MSSPFDPSRLHREFCDLRPAGGFRVLLADPPWLFENRSAKGEAKNPNQHYGCMTLDDIKNMPVVTLAAKHAALFMWVTWPLMPVWADVIREWGFDYAGLAWEWIKYNPETGKYAFGPGYGTRKNLEPCLLASRGDPPLRSSIDDLFSVDAKGSRSVRDFIEWNPFDCIRSPRREHSRKPDEQYGRIETLFDGPYVEIFARQRRPGWSAWGNQIDRFEEA